MRAPNGVALLIENRQDENRIVAGLHTLMARFHNQWVTRLEREQPRLAPYETYARARRTVPLHYQCGRW